MSQDKPLQVACPTCHTKVVWSNANPDRPFCSHRCKLIDLGAWASESHRIAGETAMDETTIDEMVLQLERQNAQSTL